MKALEMESRCIHLEEDQISQRFGAVSFPIYQTSAYAHPGVGQSTGYDYSRVQNPTREHLEKIVASLECGCDAIAFSSGMAAIAAVMELFRPQDHIVADADLYGGTTRYFEAVSEKNGLTFTCIDFSKDDIAEYVRPQTKAFFIETPTNPMMHVADIQKTADIAHERGILVIVDNTFMSPYLQNPLALGADIVIHSGTKYLAGHNDTLAGFAVVKDPALSERIRFLYKNTGACLSPMDSWLVIRGIQTLAVRMDRAQENAMELAVWLKERAGVTKVMYPGLADHSGHHIMQKQARGYGAMLSFEVDSKERAVRMLERLRMIHYAESLGGVQTLLTSPVVQTHADVPKEQLERNGISERILRMSVGIESIRDLKADLLQALEE